MPRQKYHRDRVYQIVGEPGPGSIAVGYVRYSSELQDPTTLVTQKQRIQEFADKKGWKIARWYEEVEQSTGNEDVEQRSVFTQLLSDADVQFHAVICSTCGQWTRKIVVAYDSFAHLRRLGVWWATADGLWDIDKVERERHEVFCCLQDPRPPKHRISRKGVN